MGFHYVPRLYLRAFSADDRVWAYDRTEKRCFRSSIDNVAQQTKYYSDELEQHFSRDIEGPVASLFRSIRGRSEIDADGRRVISDYLTAQIKRVPAGKQRFLNMFPKVAEETQSSIREGIARLAREQPELSEIAERRTREVDEIIERYVRAPPAEIWHRAIGPQHLAMISRAIYEMRWRYFYIEDGVSQFLTSDNPVFVFDGLGLGNQRSEMSFPVSSDVLLCADRWNGLDGTSHKASRELIMEANRRTVSRASRWVFALRNDSWVSRFCYKRHPQLKGFAP